MEQQIIIYDTLTKMIRYTVESPFSEDTLNHFQNLVQQDASISMLITAKSDIHDKCIGEIEGQLQLIDRPEYGATYVLNDTVLTINNVKDETKLLIDKKYEYLYDEGSEGSVDIELDTNGTYEIVLIKEPYKEQTITVSINAY